MSMFALNNATFCEGAHLRNQYVPTSTGETPTVGHRSGLCVFNITCRLAHPQSSDVPHGFQEYQRLASVITRQFCFIWMSNDCPVMQALSLRRVCYRQEDTDGGTPTFAM